MKLLLLESGVKTTLVSVSADGSKGVKQKLKPASSLLSTRFSIRRWIEGCEASIPPDKTRVKRIVSVSADGSKGVKHNERKNF